MEAYIESPYMQTSAAPATPSITIDAEPRVETQTEREDSFAPWWTVGSLLLTDIASTGVVGAIAVLVGSLMGSTASLELILGAGGIAVAVLLAALALTGQYRVAAHPAEEMRQIGTLVFLLGGVAGGVAGAFWFEAGAGIFGLGLLAALVLPLGRVAGRLTFARFSWWGIPAVVLGTKEHGANVVQTLRRWPEIGLRPVAHLQRNGADAPAHLRDGELTCAPDIARSYRSSYAVVAIPNLDFKEQDRIVNQYGKFFERIVMVPHTLGPDALWTTGSSCHGLVGYDVQHYRTQTLMRGVKRVVDVLAAALGLALLFPLFVTIAFLIKTDSKGPVFFRQARMGRKGECFTVLKFRTMFLNAEERLQEILDEDPERRAEYEKYHKLRDDPRVTRIGKWLRRTSLDELPQLLNVLRGDMSLVGPRAYMPSELPKMNGLSRSVLQCPPGITGLWQVSGRNKLDFETRVNLDVHYMQHWSFWLDLYILVRTLPAVLSGDGAN